MHTQPFGYDLNDPRAQTSLFHNVEVVLIELSQQFKIIYPVSTNRDESAKILTISRLFRLAYTAYYGSINSIESYKLMREDIKIWVCEGVLPYYVLRTWFGSLPEVSITQHIKHGLSVD